MSDIRADVLEAVADLYENGELEWLQEASFSPSFADSRNASGACLLGSVECALVRRFGGMDSDTFLAVHSVLVDHLPCGGVPVWNDTPGRTKQEIIDLCHEVAKDLRNEAVLC